jgi:hypothetical protein
MEKSRIRNTTKFVLFSESRKDPHGSLLKRGHSIKESDPSGSEHPLVFTAQKNGAIAPARHITSGLRIPPFGIVAVRYGRHSSEANEAI